MSSLSSAAARPPLPLRPYLLCAPALVLFAALLLAPLLIIGLLSFHAFDYNLGVQDSWTLHQYLSVFTDDYYYSIFFRTFWISLLTTALCALIGVPEAYILSRMSSPWKSIFLLIVLPLTGVHLPLTKTLIVITFVVGLLPVIGNLISNTLIVIVALSISLWVALGALIFLILIHKLEYFLNAKIVGHRIHARAWEILLAMLVMEAAFGLPGVVAAPIYYAYLKGELTAARLI